MLDSNRLGTSLVLHLLALHLHNPAIQTRGDLVNNLPLRQPFYRPVLKHTSPVQMMGVWGGRREVDKVKIMG